MEKKQEWKSIKVTEETYKHLKKMGKGIGKAVEILVKRQREAFEEKLEDVEEVAGDIASVLLESGIFDISFKGAGIEDIEENGTMVRIKGFINIDIPDEDARAQIMSIIKGEEEEEENVSSKEDSE